MPSNTGRRDLEAERLGGDAQVRFEHLADVHTRRHAERVQADFHRSAVREERHVFLRHDLGDHALVAVAAGHLVTDRELALRGDVDLHLLDDARIDVVARSRPGPSCARARVSSSCELVLELSR